MTITHNTDQLIERVSAKVAELAPDSPKLKEALTRIGLYVTGVAKLNVRGQNLIDTGRLINSIRYEFFREGTLSGIRVGSFNVPYAAVHEFGYRGTVQVPAHTRRMTQAFGRPIDPRSVEVSAHSMQMNLRPRPYMRPAIKSTSAFIIDTLRAAISFAKE